MRLIAVAILFLLTSPLRSSDGWTLTKANFDTEQVSLIRIDADSVVIARDATQRTIPMGEFLQLERQGDDKAPRGRFVLYLSGGERLSGEPLALEEEVLRWKSPSLGEVKIPLRRALLLARADHSPVSLGEQRAEDVVRMINGDVVRGIVSTISEAQVELQSGGIPSAAVPLDALLSLSFASSASTPPPSATSRFHARFADGSSVNATAIALADGKLQITLDGAPRAVDPALLLSIEQLNGPVSWISSHTPVESVHVPFLDTSWPARMDRSVTGSAIRFNSRTFARGIGVHSYSRLTFALPDGYRAFRTQYAIDGHGAYANVTVRIKLDGKTVHEREHVTAGNLSPVVTLDLAGAKMLTLEVDYGAAADVQDRFNWIEPALLRDVPASTTQP